MHVFFPLTKQLYLIISSLDDQNEYTLPPSLWVAEFNEESILDEGENPLYVLHVGKPVA